MVDTTPSPETQPGTEPAARPMGDGPDAAPLEIETVAEATPAPEAPEPAAEPTPPEPPQPAAPTSPAAAPAATKSAPMPAPFAPAPEPPSLREPTIAASVEVPPLVLSERSREASQGGEWELLVSKVNAWLGSGELQKLWTNLRGPLKGVALLVLLAMALKVYGSVVNTIDAIPVVNGLLELVGLIALGRFSANRLLRTKDRTELLNTWGRRWHDFSGR